MATLISPHALLLRPPRVPRVDVVADLVAARAEYAEGGERAGMASYVHTGTWTADPLPGLPARFVEHGVICGRPWLLEPVLARDGGVWLLAVVVVGGRRVALGVVELGRYRQVSAGGTWVECWEGTGEHLRMMIELYVSGV